MTFGLEAVTPYPASFDQFRVYQHAFTKESITSFILFHVLIIVLSLLPDFVICIVRYMRETLVMQQFDDKKESTKSVKFENKNNKSMSRKDCKLERFNEISFIEASNQNGLRNSNNFQDNNNGVQTNSISYLNSASNELPQINPSAGINDLGSYDNPSFECDIPLQNLPSHSSKL